MICSFVSVLNDKKKRPTRRALDGWYAQRFLSNILQMTQKYNWQGQTEYIKISLRA